MAPSAASLFRPKDTDFQRRRLSKGVETARRRATRQRHGHGLSWRSSNARSWRYCGRQAPRHQRRQDPYKIPVLPISWEMLCLCFRLAGPVAPENGAAVCRLPIMSVPPGESSPESRFQLGLEAGQRCDRHLRDRCADEWVIRGNHYDAWVNAPTIRFRNGRVLEEARVLASCTSKDGSERTIIFCAGTAKSLGCWLDRMVETIATNFRTCGRLHQSDSNGAAFPRGWIA